MLPRGNLRGRAGRRAYHLPRMRRSAYVVVLLGLMAAAVTVRLPYYAVAPGRAVEVQPLIDYDGMARYPSAGRLILTSVEVRELTSLDAALAWLDPASDVVARDVLFLPGESEAEEEERARSAMDQSQVDAVYVALHSVGGYPEEHGRGALVESVVSGCPADGELFPGDRVVAVDGRPVGSRAAVGRAIDRAVSGEPIRISVRAGGEDHDVEVTRARCVEDSGPIIGVVLVETFPFTVRIQDAEIGGPSAGLMFALGLYDLLTPGDLTGGRTIAGTGVLSLGGRVTGIGGIEQKVIAAERAGADVFLVPRGNLDEARRVLDDGPDLVPIGSFDEALDALGAGGSP